jgi:hypothetical protein
VVDLFFKGQPRALNGLPIKRECVIVGAVPLKFKEMDVVRARDLVSARAQARPFKVVVRVVEREA